ncbi:hypothetical protein BKA61DRAFT_620058 [Leptodontidium sp. MPI-SDFR-AT-0119]|nr:hypothetical protein BKA61DRAFT_620058 [Leptodontidium sp. MPI-SDFR-AT-0119]
MGLWFLLQKRSTYLSMADGYLAFTAFWLVLCFALYSSSWFCFALSRFTLRDVVFCLLLPFLGGGGLLIAMLSCVVLCCVVKGNFEDMPIFGGIWDGDQGYETVWSGLGDTGRQGI